MWKTKTGPWTDVLRDSRLLGGLKDFWKQENQVKISSAAEGFLQEPMRSNVFPTRPLMRMTFCDFLLDSLQALALNRTNFFLLAIPRLRQDLLTNWCILSCLSSSR